MQIIKIHGSESLGQEAACIHVRDNYIELLTQMAALKFAEAVTSINFST